MLKQLVRKSTLALALGVVALSTLMLADTRGGTPELANAQPPPGVETGTREIDPQFRKANAPIKLVDEQGLPPKAQGDEHRPPKVGDQRVMVALDDARGIFYLKFFTLRGSSLGAEVWVANNLNFPVAGQLDPRDGSTFSYTDCRNDGIRNVITDAQVAYMLGEFDKNIRPTDIAWFGEPARRNGTNGVLDDILGFPSKSYFNGPGRDIILVDNVRDDNYYDPDNQSTLPYIAGFYTGAMGFYIDRNVITIDAFDWVHRTGANPPHDPSADPCTSAPARPFLYEGVFAHEYQHLIHADYDPDELSWVNEGLSDLAEILTGYSDPSRKVDEKGADSHTLGFQGWSAVTHPDWNPIPRASGPENSLTAWEDQGSLEILADYGHAYYFMTYLQGRGHGQAFFKSLVDNPLNGIDGLNDSLAAAGSTDTFDSLWGDVQVSVLADAFVDDGAVATGITADRVQNPGTNSTVHFTGDAYDTTGAPPWGSDFVPLGPGSALTSLAFDGDDEFTFAPAPQWGVDADGYFAVAPTGTYPPMADLSITHEVAVGAGTLTFEHYYEIEVDWDFGFVQISDDGGLTWNTVACPGTTSQHDSGALSSIVANLPGYSGVEGTAAVPTAVTCDLSAWSGQNVILAFRFMSDPAVEMAGWFVRNVQVDGVDVGTPGSLAGWSNQQAYLPVPLDFELRLVGLSGQVDTYGHVSDATDVVLVEIALDGANAGAATAEQLAALAGADQVVAIVSSIPLSEESTIYGPYSLTANGAEMADGNGVINPW
ncbi:MAG TPA: hypothetical protein VIH05_02120 [Tepidiformaceae bacterium]